jgi:hypothetical protein
MSTTDYGTDGLGVTIRPDDTVMIASWGWQVRLQDAGRRCTIIRRTRANLVLDGGPAGTLRARPSQVQVLRRDGERGFEGNRKEA